MSGGTMQQSASPNIGTPIQSNVVPNQIVGGQLTTQQTTQQQSNVLLNQALGPVTNQTTFIGNTNPIPNLVASNQSNLSQIVNQGSIMPQQNAGQSQQFGILQNPVNPTQQNVLNQRPPGVSIQNERQQNLMTIKQLERTLQEAKIKELEYQAQQAEQHQHQHQQHQQHQQQQQQLQQQQQTQVQIRQHLQHQLQQKQQQQQQVNNNPNLRHLLQQQQLRTATPQQIIVPQQNIGLVQQQGGQFRLQQPNLSQIAGQQQQQLQQPQQQTRQQSNWDDLF